MQHQSTTRSVRRSSPEYYAWASMIQRCYNPSNPSYRNYGERGIRVCQRWRESFESFLADMGQRPSSYYSLERLNNNGDYTPKNTKWATRAEQCRNRRNNHYYTHQGETKTIKDWAVQIGISATNFKKRIQRGWSAERIMLSPRR